MRQTTKARWRNVRSSRAVAPLTRSSGPSTAARSATRATWFTNVLWQAPLDERDEYKPGNRTAFDIGVSYPWIEHITLQLQLNTLWKLPDSGARAEPEDSGGVFVQLSPGISVALGDKTQLYGFVQVPLYQYVNGVQLIADWSVAAGLSHRF